MSLVVEVQKIPLVADKDGVMRIGETRVTLDTVVNAFDQGHIAEEIVNHHPTLRLADVYAVISYYLNYQAEVNVYLKQQQADAKKVWTRIEADTNHQAFRERLMLRRQARASTNN